MLNSIFYEFRENPNPLKLAYSSSDLGLWAKHRKIKISMPKIFPVNSVKVMRGCLFAMQKNCLPLFAQKVFDAYWGNGLDISNEGIILGIAKDAGLSPIEFKNYIELQSTKDALISNSSELIERGGFGSPTFFYNNHMFFGNDRLHLLEEAISKELI